MKKLFIIALVIIFLTIPVFASSDFLADKTQVLYNDDNGLLTGKANDIVQTDDGFIYIAQYSGLTRYDGRNFTTITKGYGLNGEEYEISGVVKLYASENILWVGTQEYGLFSYENGYFKRYSLDDIEKYYVYSICGGDSIYTATSKGIYELRDGYFDIVTNAISNDIAYAKNGLYYIDSETRDVYESTSVATEKIQGLEKIKSIYAYGDSIYYGDYYGNMIIQDNDGNRTNITLGLSTAINDFYVHKNTIYIVTDKGVFTCEDNVVKDLEGLSISTSIEKIIVDYEESIWIASSSKGVLKILNSSFTNLFFKYGIKEREVNAITRYDDILYVGMENGLLGIKDGIVENTLTEALMETRIRDLTIYNGKLYVATYDSNIYDLIEYDKTAGIKNISANDLLLAKSGEYFDNAGQIRCVKSSGEYLVVSSNYGISVFKNGILKSVCKTPNRALSINLTANNIYACLQNIGLYRYDYDLTNETIIDKTADTTPLKSIIIDNTLLFSIGTKLFYNENNVTNEVDITFAGSVVGLFEINSKIWALTDAGIYIFSKDDMKDKNINYEYCFKDKGLIAGISANSTCYLEDNDLYLATLSGVLVTNQARIEKKNVAPKMAVTRFVVDDKVYNVNDIIRIDKASNRLVIDFAVLSYINDENTLISYWLEGYDKGPITAKYSELSSISYTNLKGGKYVFHISSTNGDGIVSDNSIKIHFDKEYKIIERIWFKIFIIGLSVFVFIGIAEALHLRVVKNITKRKDEYREITKESIEAIAMTIDAKDHYTNGHSLRVGFYTQKMAEKLGYVGEALENIYYTALLHDIGKVGIPDVILNKPCNLTDEEKEIMRSHTTIGTNIISSIKTIPNITDGVKYHHERFDGKGYPCGCTGEEIPFIASIICCADAYDAMSTKRVYRDRLSDEVIIQEFEKGKGTQFDPRVTDVIIELIKNGQMNYN